MPSTVSHENTFPLLIERKEMENEARQNTQVNKPQISIYLSNLGKVRVLGGHDYNASPCFG